jgi:hypothetical protein
MAKMGKLGEKYKKEAATGKDYPTTNKKKKVDES